MIEAGDIVVFEFPRTDLGKGKLRPALLLKQLPMHEDWLVCMISTQLHQQISGLEVVLRSDEKGFTGTGLKRSSLFRVSRIAVVDVSVFQGKIGRLDKGHFSKIRSQLAEWILEV